MNYSPALKDIGVEIAKAQLWIPTCNRKKFDIEVKSFSEELQIADSQERYSSLVNRLRFRLNWLKNHHNAYMAPPMLARRIGESEMDYRERCHEEWRRC